MKIKPLDWEERRWTNSVTNLYENSTFHSQLSGYAKYDIDLYEIRKFSDGWFVSFTLFSRKRVAEGIKTLEKAKQIAQKDWEKFVGCVLSK